jgi:metal-dependent hydrolase (beta-lactamase superfamily II)
MHFDWESLTDSVCRCRLPFLDVTVGLVQGSAGALLVDTGTTLTEAKAIRDDVREIAGCDVTHVVLTHKHFDHVLGSVAHHAGNLSQTPCDLSKITALAKPVQRLRRYGSQMTIGMVRSVQDW